MFKNLLLISNKIKNVSIHTSSTQKAIPPVLWLIIKPVSKIGSILFGRYQ